MKRATQHDHFSGGLIPVELWLAGRVGKPTSADVVEARPVICGGEQMNPSVRTVDIQDYLQQTGVDVQSHSRRGKHFSDNERHKRARSKCLNPLLRAATGEGEQHSPP